MGKPEPEVTEQVISEEEATRKPDRNVTAAIWAIICGVALPCIPVVVVCAVLLYIIFRYRVIIRPGWVALQLVVDHTASHQSAIDKIDTFRHRGGSAAYYVRYNPSTITTIASWTSRVIPYLSSSIMALVAFFAARRIVTKSRRGNGSDLPSPEQLTLLIGLLGGTSIGPLKDALFHRWAKKEKLIDPIPLAFCALFMITFLGLLIPMIDTWFGIATTPEIVTQLYNTTQSAYQSFGRTLNQQLRFPCPGGFNALHNVVWMPCNLSWDEQDGDAILPSLSNASEAVAITQGSSTTDTVLNYTATDGTIYHYLASQGLHTHLDFQAKTFAVSAQCKPITRHCSPSPTNIEGAPLSAGTVIQRYKFECSRGFRAQFNFTGAAQTPNNGPVNDAPSSPMVGLAFSPDAEFSHRIGEYLPQSVGVEVLKAAHSAFKHTHNGTGDAEDYAFSALVGTNLSYAYIHPQNPLHFVTWATGFPAGYQAVGSEGDPYTKVPPGLLRDPEVYHDNNYAYWILGCSATVYDVDYTWVNGSLHTFTPTPSTADMGGLVSAPFAFGMSEASMALMTAANVAGQSSDSTVLAETFARGWSQAAIALAVGGLVPAQNEIEQVRNGTVAVARVPLIPLYLLLGAKALYVLTVILLAIGAYCFTHPAETEVVKAQLSAKGLAAAHFDTPDLLQQNVVQEIQKRLQSTKSTDEKQSQPSAPPTVPLASSTRQKAQTWPIQSSTTEGTEKKKVGVVAHADGAWRFAVVADGVWKSIKPVAINLVEVGAEQGVFGTGVLETAGEALAAWE